MYEINLSPGKTAADFDGDGKTDISVFRPANSYWYLKPIAAGEFSAVDFGIPGDGAVPD